MWPLPAVDEGSWAQLVRAEEPGASAGLAGLGKWPAARRSWEEAAAAGNRSPWGLIRSESTSGVEGVQGRKARAAQRVATPCPRSHSETWAAQGSVP